MSVQSQLYQLYHALLKTGWELRVVNGVKSYYIEPNAKRAYELRTRMLWLIDDIYSVDPDTLAWKYGVYKEEG